MKEQSKKCKIRNKRLRKCRKKYRRSKKCKKLERFFDICKKKFAKISKEFRKLAREKKEQEEKEKEEKFERIKNEAKKTLTVMPNTNHLVGRGCSFGDNCFHRMAQTRVKRLLSQGPGE